MSEEIEKSPTEKELYEEAVEAKRLELEATHKVPVHAFVINVSSDFPEEPYAVAYLKEPDRHVKMKAIDMAENSPTMAGDIVVKTCLLSESDKRILSENYKSDTLYLTVIRHARTLILYYSDVIKKN